MAKNLSKIYKRTALMMLVIIVSGLLNICLFAFQAKAATMPMATPKLNFAYDNNGNCVAQPMLEPEQTIGRPVAPMPECCLAQNRYYNAMVNTVNNESTPIFSSPIILSSNNLNPENSFTHDTARLIYPPPEGLALASIVIRE